MSQTPVRRIAVDDDEDVNPEFNPKVTQTMGNNPLDALREAIQAEVAKPDITLQIITREGMSIRFGTNIDMDTDIARWRRSSQDKTQPDNFNLLKFSQLVIANCTLAVALNGEEPSDEAGQPITFTSSLMLEWTNVKRPLDAVRTLYGSDGHIIATAQEIMEAAGYGDEMREAGDDTPTRRS